MILADTSVWIDYLNGKITPASDLLDACLVEGTLAMGDIVFLEILQGIRDDKQFRKVKSKLSLLDEYTLFGPSMVIKCANNFRALRNKGITVRKTNDVIIATYCIEQKIPLLYADRDFNPFSDHLGLISALA
ncbi:type II toxin-antitoxin system VapC family toxin [Endozoicomonas sp. ALD040]|uniref:type II toxin-antitoxin system VapC family toxin n=1 Tax=unclassified Endozoicomonas TaxID=2644528 RepID=UPI003BAFAF59